MNLSTIVAIFILGWLVGFGMAYLGCYLYFKRWREWYEKRRKELVEQGIAVESAKQALAADYRYIAHWHEDHKEQPVSIDVDETRKRWERK